MKEDIKEQIEKEKHHEVHKSIHLGSLSKKHHEAKNKIKKHMYLHLGSWVAITIAAIILVVLTLLFIMGLQ